YPARAMMVGRRAPAKRLGFLLRDNTPANLTPDAIKPLDASLGWLTRAPPACGTPPRGVENLGGRAQAPQRRSTTAMSPAPPPGSASSSSTPAASGRTSSPMR